MLLPAETSTGKLIAAAAIVHPLVSLFWAAILWRVLPRSATLEWAMLAGVLIGLLDFWPQMADHLMWGALLGLTVQRK